ncbi:ATP-dependent DNA helicase PIF1 [Drepanopeziza brunnea f. sp. 'multigermtubi' MB_m1]|uniref:ATP-dependent DNA helicase PIF1 n=1 Tax=Marssonina brunnea f. sp. multigermtubi (strain MB_m1) TaxID=1072389 RepID=K1WU67_MARBU|nr:ATP-dependent DNA helicase PIF1 [Drepanopeziza brunnea f. sp. 'multigermtubi' MB_m1]EKD12123.1 ATP-dependent DNA helicase PIF1 [Drepanopeziza brunnea f. sp. 'multigermtubi' MB_m1]
MDSLLVDKDIRERVTTIEDETPEQPLLRTAAPAATESSAQKRRRLRREARGNLEENSSEDEALVNDENALPDVKDHLDPDDDLPDDQERPPLETTVPDLNPNTTESNQLFAQVNKLASKQHLFSLAFPTLFLTGASDFHTQRFRKVSIKDYAEHLMRYRDGRFATHSRFRFYLFNILMRLKVAKVSSYFVKSRKDIKDLSIDSLRDQLKEQPALLNQIVRCKQAIDGTRPF